MIVVAMAQHQAIQVRDSHRAQRRHDDRFAIVEPAFARGPGIEQQGMMPSAHQHRTALPDVDDDDFGLALRGPER